MSTEALLELLKPPLVGGNPAPADAHWNWDEILSLAERHGAMPLLASAIAEMSSGTVPDAIRQSLETRQRQVTVWNLRLAGELKRLLDVLTGEGIRTLAFKGPTLACRAFGNVGLREFLDLDLLVPPESGRKAIDLVCEHGYRYYDNLEPWQYDRHLERGRQLPLCSEDRKFRLEIHTSLVRKNGGWKLEFEPLWERHVEVDVCGSPVAALSPEDLFVYLSIHGGKHRWERLAWIADLVALQAGTPTLDWPRVEQLAEAARAQKAVALASSLMERLSANPPRGSVQQPTRQIRALCEQVFSHLQTDRGKHSGFYNAWFAYQLRDRRRDGLRAIFQQSLEPTVADFQATRLSPGHSWGYWLVRPIRLLQKYLRKWG